MTRFAVVCNPTKLDDVADAQELVRQYADAHGWELVAWLETTPDDVGHGQTEEAVGQGVDLVIAWGGDGTVRAVADVVAGTDVALGIIPAGTGNLLCRNLAIPLNDPEQALDIALAGESQRIDVGKFSLDGGPEETFLVIAGAGLDADVMDNTDDAAKERIGWFAYVGGVVRSLVGDGFKARNYTDGKFKRVRSIMACNCGIIGGGLNLAPDALIDDGELDLVALAPKWGWLPVVVNIMMRGRIDSDEVRRGRGKRATFEFDRPVLAQVDGDTLTKARTVRARVEPQALTVRVPTSR